MLRSSIFIWLVAVTAALIPTQTVCADNPSPIQSTGPKTTFTIVDAEKFEPVRSGRWKLSGTLEIKFAGRIVPHENSTFLLFGGNVESIEGMFDKLVLPPGWSADLGYTRRKHFVELNHFRRSHPPAFPGAEGFGKYTQGGRGGRVIEVTNLNDHGPGSFRTACEAKGPRIVVFRISGTIPLESKFVIRNPFITIAGQSAPGDGICVKGQDVKIDTEHVIVRYMRFRPGDEGGKELDGFGGGKDHVIIDHCSVSWGIDEVLSINKCSNLSVQWCMITESLYDSVHHKGKHGYGGLWGGPGGSWHHNILAHHTSRNPRASGNVDSGLMDMRNNVIYNWGFNSAYGGELWPRNWINNYYKPGPATRDNVRHRIFIQGDDKGKMFADGNFVVGAPDVSADNWNGGIEYQKDKGASEKTLKTRTPFMVAPVRTQKAEDAYELALKHAGASLKRDSVDARIIDEIRTGTAHFGETWGGGGKGIINSQKAVGGWPELKSLPAPADTDHDGIPDEWETSHGLNPQQPTDGSLDRDNDGYTNVEEYLNSLVPAIYQNNDPARSPDAPSSNH